MKKVLLSLVALMTIGVSAWADGISVEDVIIRKGKSASAFVKLTTDASFYSGFSFEVVLPEGITSSEMTFQQIVNVDGQEVAVDVTGPKGIAGQDIPGNAAFVVTSSYVEQNEPQTIRFACYSGAGNPINTAAGDFIVLEIPLNATGASLNAEDVLSATVKNIHFSTAGSKDVVFDEASFNITIADKYLVLYDTETEAPAAAENEDVKVVRAIKAGWNTICLPFAMTEEQIKSAFGEESKIGNFVGCDVIKTGSAITSIKVKFESATNIEANHPYIINVAQEQSEFTVEGVTIRPITNPAVRADAQEYEDEYGDTQYRYNQFIGTYKANTKINNNSLFLRDGKFYYSTGSTYMNAFRGYFRFYSQLTDKAISTSATVKMQFDDDPTAIDIINGEPVNVEGMYDLSGRKLNDMPKTKGVYVIDGKKVAIK